MAKLTDLFGRKGSEAGAHGRGNGNGEHRAIEGFADIGSALGEENEVLRNLLTDTGRKIGELDELKQAFDKIVAPFNSTLRALEQEKSQTLGLTGMLNESRTAYETLRTEFYQLEKKATAIEAEAERLRIDLEKAFALLAHPRKPGGLARQDWRAARGRGARCDEGDANQSRSIWQARGTQVEETLELLRRRFRGQYQAEGKLTSKIIRRFQFCSLGLFGGGSGATA